MKSDVKIVSPSFLQTNFVPSKFLPSGKDEYYIRDLQLKASNSFSADTKWRHLTLSEISILEKNENTCENWDNIYIIDNKNNNLLYLSNIKNNNFYGLVRIGEISNAALSYDDLIIPIGITNSTIISCEIGNNCAIHNVKYLSHYIIGNQCILFNIKEIITTHQAKFGNGFIKQGENQDDRRQIEVMNEAGCRKVTPFQGMIAADAYLEAKFIDDYLFQDRLLYITQNSLNSELCKDKKFYLNNKHGFYGTIDNNCVIKNCVNIIDLKVGKECYIQGITKLKNITINSSSLSPTKIRDGVILENGIVGYGCEVFNNCIAKDFILGENCKLENGARFINSILGDNSTVACCEVLNNLIFPGHEQHHNNSFLIASLLKGQTNIAAGATIGSNHNSRSADNEIEAGRGFWPGLCSSIKHSSKFACFVLLSKSDFPCEMNIPLPFALVNNNPTTNQLEIMPAYWWMYNMYALQRNSWKYQDRDKRIYKTQNIEFDYLAPDSIEEIRKAKILLQIWTARAFLKYQYPNNNNEEEAYSIDDLKDLGYKLLNNKNLENIKLINSLSIFGTGMEKGSRKVKILKTFNSYQAYGDMIIYYTAKNILTLLEIYPNINFKEINEKVNILSDKYSTYSYEKNWLNLGGQLVNKRDFEDLRNDICSGTINSWDEIHNRYNILFEKYPIDKILHAYFLICESLKVKEMDNESWAYVLNKAKEIQKDIDKQTKLTRKKDDENVFRKATYRNEQEQKAALGSVEENSFVKLTNKESIKFYEKIDFLLKKEI